MFTRVTRARGLAGLLGLLLAAQLGCECTLIGCVPETTVLVDAASWPAGEYTVTATGDAGSHSCTFVHTLEQRGSCFADAGLWVRLGDGDLATKVSLLDVQLPQIEVQITRDGQVLLDGRFATELESSWPNGRFCGECQTPIARVSL